MIPLINHRIDFELYKSDICHHLKSYGDKQFIIDVLTGTVIESYFKREWYAEALYLLAMVDYISRVNGIPYCSKYNHLRHYKLKRVLYPRGVLLLSKVNETAKQESWDDCIPEFKRHNIVENEVRNIA